jgi:tetratricopeptide (TPR) repeat protein
MGRFSQLEPTGGNAPQEETGNGAPALGASALGAAAATPAPAPPRGGKVVRPQGAPGDLDDDAPEGRDAPATSAQGDDAYFSGNWDRALRLYSRAIQLDSTLVAPWAGQVYALLRKGQHSEAMTWANRALEVFPEHPSLLGARGVVYAAQGMVRRAVGASDYALSKGGDAGGVARARGNPAGRGQSQCHGLL